LAVICDSKFVGKLWLYCAYGDHLSEDMVTTFTVVKAWLMFCRLRVEE